ncbi:MAG: preprotein translocase subunit SecE [Patescibacteria group bacterium]|mgnify:CR=1 FL=1
MRKVISFISEVRVELTHVTWPKREEVIKLTLIVFILSGVIGGYVGSFDYLFTKLLEVVVSK